MQYLLIDNSNSRTKFILSSAQQHVGPLVRVQTSQLTHQRLAEVTKDWKFDAVLVCSVVPRVGALMQAFFADVPFHLLAHDSPHGIQIEIDSPEQIGADRIANAVGVMELYSPPAVVVDFGTAVTFDVISEGGVYRGGVIAPGLGSMNDYLSENTALLPRIKIEEPERAIGKSTIEAMRSGAVYGYRGMVQGILQAIGKELKSRPLIVSTGGDGKIIADGIPEIDEFSSQITLEGLRAAAVKIF